MEETTVTAAEAQPVKLTKKALKEFIGWTTSRYNNYLGFGTKKQAVDDCYLSIQNGFHTTVWYRKDKTPVIIQHENEKVFELRCASPVGENGNYNGGFKAWRTKQSGDDYTVDCIAKTITAKNSKRIIKFI